jgi:hypothetical protein
MVEHSLTREEYKDPNLDLPSGFITSYLPCVSSPVSIQSVYKEITLFNVKK